MLYFISPREGEISYLVLQDTRKCIPRRAFKEFFGATEVVLSSRKVEGSWPTWPPVCAGPRIAVNKSKCKYFEMILKFVIILKYQFYSAVFYECEKINNLSNSCYYLTYTK